MDSETEIEYTIKILLVGDTNVGKTNIIYRYFNNQYNQYYMATTGIDLKSTTIELKGKKLRIQLWDTAGQEKYRSITSNLFLKVQGFLVVYDITNEKSFINLKDWIKSIKEECGSHIPIIVVGNKNDLDNERLISKNEAISYAKSEKLEYIETSSKTGENVKEVILLIIQKILETSELENDRSFSLDSSHLINKKKHKCC